MTSQPPGLSRADRLGTLPRMPRSESNSTDPSHPTPPLPHPNVTSPVEVPVLARRPFLSGLIGTAGLLGLATGCRTRTPSAPKWTTSRLLGELDRLRGRDYTQEGIPMLLLGENLDRSTRPRNPVPPAPSSLPAEFREMTRLLERGRDQLSEEDVAALVELLADREIGPASTPEAR